jgi:hypothetical protein
MRNYLDRWRDQAGAGGAEAASAALSRLAELLDERAQRGQIARTRRVNAATYVVDLLFEYGAADIVEAALSYIISTGPREAVSAQRVAGARLAAQRVEAGAAGAVWEGPLEAFPPHEWLGAGEVLLLMPMDAGPQQQVLLGVIERTEQEHLDLDDMLLRSINTYRSITVLNETLRELDAARSVQLSLLPRDAPRTEDYDITGAARAARHVGGDLYGPRRC